MQYFQLDIGELNIDELIDMGALSIVIPKADDYWLHTELQLKILPLSCKFWLPMDN